MEENLRKLLEDLIEQETDRKKAQEDIIEQIEREKGMLSIKEQTEIERFIEGMKEDIETGMYNNRTENEMQKVIDETKNSIMERYNIEREKLSKKLEDAKKEQEEDKENLYKQINSEIKEYHLDSVLETAEAQRNLDKLEEERKNELARIDKEIDDIERARTSIIMRNRDSLDALGTTVAGEITALGIKISQLTEERNDISKSFDEKIEVQSQYLQQCTEKKDRIAKVIGGISLSDKSFEEIHQILFGDEELEEDKEVSEDEQPIVNKEVIEEKEPEEVVEQPVEEVVEQPVVEEPVVEERQSEKVIAQQVVEKVVAQPVAEVVIKEQPVQKVAKQVKPVVEAKQPVDEKKQSISNPTKTPEEDRNYKYYLANKANIIEVFMQATGIRKNEAVEIFGNKEHCKAIAERCMRAMTSPKRSKSELYKLMEDYYWGIDSKLDIEVSNKGIQYNQELTTPADVTEFAEEEWDFVDEVVEEFEDQLLSYTSNPDKFAFDRNIIIAIAMDNCVEDEQKNLKLTLSGRKKIAEYLNLVVNPLNKNGSVTYNLEKMSLFRGIFNESAWSPKMVMGFRKIAYQAKNTYAKIIPNSIIKAQWAIKDWFKGLTTKKLTKGKTIAQKEEVKENKEKRNKWELPFEQKIFANSRRGRYETGSKRETAKEEVER